MKKYELTNDTIVVNGITYYAQPHPSLNEQVYQNRYNWLVSELQNILTEAQELYENMKLEGLIHGTIEAEGYLRCAKLINNTKDHIEESYPLESNESRGVMNKYSKI